MASLTLRNISKQFGQTRVVDSVGLDIASGEFFSIVGPSGCGKTTLLRIIAGFEHPTGGEVLLDGKSITGIAPQFRGIGMVFQNYALFPHMTAQQNVAFGLETKRIEKSEIARRVRKILEMVEMVGKASRPVPELSGGEQQRVAVARALVVEPSALLFDEPLSNLDVALRQQTREEIRSLQRSTGITTVYVTHDQAEAMSLSDRLAVMRSGRIEQVGRPAEIYESPASAFVAQFFGGANVLRGMLDESTGLFSSGDFSAAIPGAKPGGAVCVAVRPEAIELADPGSGRFAGIVRTVEFLGYTTHVEVMVSGFVLRSLLISSGQGRRLEPGRPVGVTIDWARCSVFPETG